MADTSDIKSFWEDAIRAYERECGHPLDIGREPLQTTDDLLKLIEKKHKAFQDYRNKQPKFWEGLTRVLGPAVNIGGLVQGLVASAPITSPAAVVLGGVLHLLNVSKPSCKTSHSHG